MPLSARHTERTFNFVMTELVRHSKMSWDEMKGPARASGDRKPAGAVLANFRSYQWRFTSTRSSYGF